MCDHWDFLEKRPRPPAPYLIQGIRHPSTAGIQTILELLVQSGLRIEEASELTTLDILKRKMPDERIYYLLHIKPSKFDRARVMPIGDGLGRVLAKVIRYAKRFYNSESVPVYFSYRDGRTHSPMRQVNEVLVVTWAGGRFCAPVRRSAVRAAANPLRSQCEGPRGQ
jgi:hypothetical protein